MVGNEGRRGMKLDDLIAEQMQDPEFAEEWRRLEPSYDIVKAIVEARIEAGLTQKELAQRCGLRQNAISRLENGGASPTVRTLQQLARGLGKRLEIRFV